MYQEQLVNIFASPVFNKCLRLLSTVKSESEVAQSCPILWDPVDCSLPGFLCPWDSPGKNTGVGYHFLLQGIFLTQGSNQHLLLGKQILYHWATWEAGREHTFAKSDSLFLWPLSPITWCLEGLKKTKSKQQKLLCLISWSSRCSQAAV